MIDNSDLISGASRKRTIITKNLNSISIHIIWAQTARFQPPKRPVSQRKTASFTTQNDRFCKLLTIRA